MSQFQFCVYYLLQGLFFHIWFWDSFVKAKSAKSWSKFVAVGIELHSLLCVCSVSVYFFKTGWFDLCEYWLILFNEILRCRDEDSLHEAGKNAGKSWTGGISAIDPIGWYNLLRSSQIFLAMISDLSIENKSFCTIYKLSFFWTLRF